MSFVVSSNWRWNWSKCKAVFSEATDAVKSYPCLQLIQMENFFGITRTYLRVSKLRAQSAGVSFLVLFSPEVFILAARRDSAAPFR